MTDLLLQSNFAFQERRYPTHRFEATREAAMQAKLVPAMTRNVSYRSQEG